MPQTKKSSEHTKDLVKQEKRKIMDKTLENLKRLRDAVDTPKLKQIA